MVAFQTFLRTVAIAGPLASPLLGIAAAQSASVSDRATVPVLDWQACTSKSEAGFSCATAQVPIDYSQPKGETFSLALIKHSGAPVETGKE
jgi:hypothetical protein